jgi:regulatory protein
VTEEPIDLAARSLQHRDRSRADVAARLERAGVAAEDLQATLETLERVGWVDDSRFASMRAAALAARGHGDAAIQADLAGSGVDAEQIAEALGALEPESERAKAIVAERGAGAPTFRLLARKGFGDDTIESVIAAALDARDEAGGV